VHENRHAGTSSLPVPGLTYAVGKQSVKGQRLCHMGVPVGAARSGTKKACAPAVQENRDVLSCPLVRAFRLRLPAGPFIGYGPNISRGHTCIAFTYRDLLQCRLLPAQEV